AIFLAFIALIPTLIQLAFNLPSSVAMMFGGTSLIIMVGVDLETVNQLETELGEHKISKDYRPKKRKTNKI
ncbi:MAG TPA: preprotein translocase subunit SecY, partial [Porphyromonadaceae bacterium]|nr:preprotein translocase subunit SecY [Porphyromonadaceae bacterium]